MAKSFALKLALIITLAGVVRLVHLGKIPDMFDGDEAYFGYYGFSLAGWGSDEYGRKLPVYFPSIGDYKYPVYAYASTVWVKLLGLNEAAARSASAVGGVVTVAGSMVLAGYLTSNRKMVYAVGLLMALSPWHVWMSRRALEANLGLTLLILTVVTGVQGLKSKKNGWLIWMMIFAVLAIYAYAPIRLMVVMLSAIAGVLLAARGKFKAGLAVGGVLVLAAGAFLQPESRARGSGVMIWNEQNMEEVQKRLAEDIHANGIAGGSVPLAATRIMHNKFLYVGKSFVDKVAAHFDISFLLVNGNERDRYRIPNMGLLSYAEAGLVAVGLTVLARKNLKLLIVAGGWWLASAVAPALSTEPIQSVRYAPAVVPVVFIAAWGLTAVAERKWQVYPLLLVIALNFWYFWHQYAVVKTYLRPWYLESELKQLPGLVGKHQQDYNIVALSGDPYVYFLFDRKIPPSEFLAKADIDAGIYNWSRVNKYENVVFKMAGNCPKLGKLGVLYLCKGAEVPINARIIEVVRYNDGVPAYTLIDFVPLPRADMPGLPEGLSRMVETDLRFGSEGVIPDSYPGLTL